MLYLNFLRSDPLFFACSKIIIRLESNLSDECHVSRTKLLVIKCQFKFVEFCFIYKMYWFSIEHAKCCNTLLNVLFIIYKLVYKYIRSDVSSYLKTSSGKMNTTYISVMYCFIQTTRGRRSLQVFILQFNSRLLLLSFLDCLVCFCPFV